MLLISFIIIDVIIVDIIIVFFIFIIFFTLTLTQLNNMFLNEIGHNLRLYFVFEFPAVEFSSRGLEALVAMKLDQDDGHPLVD